MTLLFQTGPLEEIQVTSASEREREGVEEGACSARNSLGPEGDSWQGH